MINLLRAYSLRETEDDVRKSFEGHAIHTIEALFYSQEPINEYLHGNIEQTASELAGYLLVFLGWETQNVDELIDRLKVRNKALELEDYGLYGNLKFKEFLSAALRHKSAKITKFNQEWPSGWGKRPPNWKGIQTLKK